jgi:hypothetical protein
LSLYDKKVIIFMCMLLIAAFSHFVFVLQY